MRLALGAFCLLAVAMAAVASADSDGDSVKKKTKDGGGNVGKKEQEVSKSPVDDVDDVSELKKEHRSIDFGIPLPDDEIVEPSSSTTATSTSTTTPKAPSSPRTQPPPPPPPPGAPPLPQYPPPPPPPKQFSKPPAGYKNQKPYPVTPKYLRPPLLGVGAAPPRHNFKSTPSRPQYPRPIHNPKQWTIQNPKQRPIQNPNQRPIQNTNQRPNQNPNQGPNQNINQKPIQNQNQRPIQNPKQRPIQNSNQRPNQRPNQNPNLRPNPRPNPRNPRPNQRPRPRNLPPPPPKQFAKRPAPRPQFRPNKPLRPPPAARPQLPPPGSRPGPPPPPPPRPLFKSPVPQKKRPATKKPTHVWKKPFPSPKYEQPEPVRREHHDFEDVQLSSYSEHEPVYEPPPPSFGFGLGGFGSLAQQPEVVVKQAGPSQSYGWLGHGRSINLNSLLIPNPFPDTMNVNTKWVPAVDHSMEQIVQLSGPTVHTAHIQPAPHRQEHSAPAPAPIPATPAPEARPPAPTYTPLPEPPAPSYAPRPVRKVLTDVRKVATSGNYHSQSGSGYRFESRPSKARQPLRPTTQGEDEGAPVYVPQSSNALNLFDHQPVKLFDHNTNKFKTHTKSFVTTPLTRDVTRPPPPSVPRPSRKTTFGGDPRTKSAASISRPSFLPPPPSQGTFKGSFIDVSAQRDYGKKQQRPQSKIDVFDVPIKVEETFEAAREKVDEGFVQFKTALATPEKNNKGGEEDVFYIFYESEGDSTTAASTTTTTLPSVKARVRPTSPRLKPFVVEEPKDSKFTPPSADDIRTIYVPIENAINVPEHFDISLGTSFGTTKKNKSKSRSRTRTPINPRQKLLHNPKRARGSSRAPSSSSSSAAVAPADLAGFKSATAAAKAAGSSYDNPISSYDAPLTIEKSYTAPQSVRGSFFDGSASTRKYQEIRRAPVDVAVEANVPGPETAESSLYEPPSDSTVFGTRLSGKRRKAYDIILDNRDTKTS